MHHSAKELCKTLIIARHENPAWQLLASRRAPLVLSCLKPLFDSNHEGILLEETEQRLAEMLAEHANNEEYHIESEDYVAVARRELRNWIKRHIVIEREGRIIATDALQQVLFFVEGLQNRFMTSTASRLATVQREIENLAAQLNPDRKSRADYIKEKIKDLKEELVQVELGNVPVLQGAKAAEGIREVYNLAMSLRADFRRVEDSYRDADRRLRQSIITEHRHRGEIVDKLLDSHDELLETAEGQVFHSFHAQLNHTIELDNMKHRLKKILDNSATGKALNRQQKTDFRWLVARLVRESRSVIQARARSERDVKGFLKTGLAAEHHRVGQLLNEILKVAVDIPWNHAAVRRSPAALLPSGIALGCLPLIERLRFKTSGEEEDLRLELREQTVDLDDVEDEFWTAFDTLDRQALIQDTLNLLKMTGTNMGIAELAQHLPPTHDLETLAIWLGMAREAELVVGQEYESVELIDREGKRVRFHVPKVQFIATALQNIQWEV